MQKIIEPQRNLQIDAAFLHTGAGACAAVLAAVPGVYDDYRLRLLRFCGRNGVPRAGDRRRAGNGQRPDQRINGEVFPEVFFEKFHANTPGKMYVRV